MPILSTGDPGHISRGAAWQKKTERARGWPQLGQTVPPLPSDRYIRTLSGENDAISGKMLT